MGGAALLRSFQVYPGLDFSKWYGTPDVSYVLALGGASTGIPFHYHPAAWLELIKGRKRWWVAPAGAKVQMNVHASPADGDTLAAENPQICAFVQEEGDIVYVPDGYFHAVANELNWTVAVGQQAPAGAPGGFVEAHGNSLRAYTRAAASKLDKDLARTAVGAVDRALAKWPDEPLLHHIRARIALDVPEANLQSVPLAEKNFLYNPRSEVGYIARGCCSCGRWTATQSTAGTTSRGCVGSCMLKVSRSSRRPCPSWRTRGGRGDEEPSLGCSRWRRLCGRMAFTFCDTRRMKL